MADNNPNENGNSQEPMTQAAPQEPVASQAPTSTVTQTPQSVGLDPQSPQPQSQPQSQPLQMMAPASPQMPGQATAKSVVVLKWWQLIVALIVVMALSVGVTVGVNLLMRGNDSGSQSVPVAEPKQEQPQKAQPDSSESTQPKGNSRGNLVKKIGEVAGITKSTTDRTEVATWTVNSITLDAPCEPTYEGAETTPVNGHFVMFDITVETTAEYDESEFGTLTLGSPAVWKYIQKDGTQWNGRPDGTISKPTTYSCLPDDQRLPGTIGQGVKVHGKVMFDLPSTDGYLVYTQGGATTGWEYAISERSDA